MPCRSDYLEATGKEVGLRRAAVLAVFVGTRLGIVVPEAIAENAQEYYGKDLGQVEWLCDQITRMSDADRERIIYDAHSTESRDLANWWEKHQAADAARRRIAWRLRWREERRRFHILAGALVRRYLRRHLDRSGILYKEDRGWFDSQFVITATDSQIAKIIAWCERINA